MSRLRRKFKTLLFSELRIAFFADFVIAIYAQDFTKGFWKKQENKLEQKGSVFKNTFY